MEQFIFEFVKLAGCKYIKINNESDLLIIYDLLKNNIIGTTYNSIICLYHGIYYKRAKDFDLMKKYYLMAIDYNNVDAMNNLAIYYYDFENNWDLMKKYYLMAIDLNNTDAMNTMGNYYQYVEINYDLMKKYYLMSIKNDNQIAMYSLGLYYKHKKKYDLMMKYYSMMQQSKDICWCYKMAMYDVAIYYQNIKEYDLMKTHFMISINCGNIYAMRGLAMYYETIEKNYNLMKKYDFMAIINRCSLTIHKYSKLYIIITQENINDAIYFYNITNKLTEKYNTITKASTNNYIIDNYHVTDYMQSMKISILLSKYNNICVNIKQVFINYKQIMVFLWIIGGLVSGVPKHVKFDVITLLVKN